MRLAAAAFGFAVLAGVAAVGVVLSNSVTVSVSEPAPSASTTPGTNAKSVRTLTQTADNRPLYPAYTPNIPRTPAITTAPVALTPPPALPSTTGQSSTPTAQPAAVPSQFTPSQSAPTPPAPAQATAPAQPAEPAAEKSAPIMFAQNTPPAPAPTPAPAAVNCPGNPNAIGVARVVEIDTTGGPGFGFEHFKSHDFLREGEVVLTFDDGPWPRNTAAVLAALARHCTRAIFFPIGLHATYEPAILKQVAAGRTRGRLAHLVAPDARQEQGALQGRRQDGDARVRSEGRDREGHQRGEVGGRRTDGAVLPLPGPQASAGARHLSRPAQLRHLLDRFRLLRLQDAQARTDARGGDGQAEEARQGHRSDARLPAPRPRRAPAGCSTTSRPAATRSSSCGRSSRRRRSRSTTR